MNLTLYAGPTTAPVSLAEAKRQLRFTASDTANDGDIISMIIAARERLEADTGRAFGTQTWNGYLDAWPGASYLELPKPPLQSVTHIKYTNSAGTETEFPASYYHYDVASKPGRVVLAYGQQWPSVTLKTANGINIRFVAGYPSYSGTVGTSTTTVTKASGSDFNTAWERGHPMTVNSIVYEIHSVTSTSVLTLRSTAGTQTGVAYEASDIPGDMRQALLILVAMFFTHRLPVGDPLEKIPLSYSAITGSRKAEVRTF